VSQSQLKLVLVHEPDSEYAMRLRVRVLDPPYDTCTKMSLSGVRCLDSADHLMLGLTNMRLPVYQKI